MGIRTRTHSWLALTLGLFLLVINAIMLAVTIWISGMLGLGLTSTGFGATFIGAIVVAIVAWVGEAITGR
jgi:putative membrane protein